MSLEISFEKRYVLLYTLILAVAHYFISKINNIFGNIFNSVWPIDVIVLIVTLLLISIFNRNQKLRVALGFFYYKQPFEKASKYIKNDNRISNTERNNLKKKLMDISNADFFSDYYSKVKNSKAVIAKNSEYCVIRDITFAIFLILIFSVLLTIFWAEHFWKEMLAIFFVYILGVISSRKKSKDFVCQIIVDYKNLKEVNHEG